jgi:hypothetical protein
LKGDTNLVVLIEGDRAVPMNFVSSVTLQFKDAFSAGFSSAKDSFAGMKGALEDINQNQSMNRLAADLAMATSLTDPLRQKLSTMMDEPSRPAGSMDFSLKTSQVELRATGKEMAAVQKELLAIGGRSVAGPLAVSGAFADVATGWTTPRSTWP